MAVLKTFINAETLTGHKIRRVAFYDVIGRYIPSTKGSYNVIAARVFDMTYAEYLRMCRDVYGGTLTGKNDGYITVSFSDSSNCDRLVKELNRRWDLIIKTTGKGAN